MRKLFKISLGLLLFWEVSPSVALPPPEEIPEEVLRMEIITEARSHEDNRPLSAEEYTLLKEKLAENPYPSQLDPEIQQLIFLVRIQKFFKTIVPF